MSICYSFYDAVGSPARLGTYIILPHHPAQRARFALVYLGYW